MPAGCLAGGGSGSHQRRPQLAGGQAVRGSGEAGSSAASTMRLASVSLSHLGSERLPAAALGESAGRVGRQ